MLSLAALQRDLMELYEIRVSCSVDDHVRPLDPRDPDAARREVVLVAERGDELGVAVLLSAEVMRALKGGPGPLSRFDAWCLALEGVSHFVRLSWRAERDEPVSQLELELQADVDKYLVGARHRCFGRATDAAQRSSRALRHALFERQRFVDHASLERGQRYRLAHRMAARYAASLERRYVRHGRYRSMVDELRRFWRSGSEGRHHMTTR